MVTAARHLTAMDEELDLPEIPRNIDDFVMEVTQGEQFTTKSTARWSESRCLAPSHKFEFTKEFIEQTIRECSAEDVEETSTFSTFSSSPQSTSSSLSTLDLTPQEVYASVWGIFQPPPIQYAAVPKPEWWDFPWSQCFIREMHGRGYSYQKQVLVMDLLSSVVYEPPRIIVPRARRPVNEDAMRAMRSWQGTDD